MMCVAVTMTFASYLRSISTAYDSGAILAGRGWRQTRPPLA